ncbi:MAG: multicopper oxidase domain-containing protein [Limisphaerales bacterium]
MIARSLPLILLLILTSTWSGVSQASAIAIKTLPAGGTARLEAVVGSDARRILWQGCQNLVKPVWTDLAVHTVAGTVDSLEVPIGGESRFFRVRVETEELADPVELRSVDGVLDITLEAHPSSQVIELANPTSPLAPGIPTLVDGFYTYAWTIHTGASSTGASSGDGPQGPTLAVQPGDRLRIRLKNNLPDQPTNLHTHGLVISPSGNADNVLLSIPPGMSNLHEYEIPSDTEPGISWYHPHRHGYTADQVYRGLAGFLIVGDRRNNIDQIESLPTRLMMVQAQSVQPDPTTGRPTLVPLTSVDSGHFQLTINGRYMPDIRMRSPYELWIGLQLDVRDLIRTFQPVSLIPAEWDWDGIKSPNVQSFYAAQDGKAFPETVGNARVALAPGKRVSEIVSAPREGQVQYFVATAIQPSDLTTEYTQPIARIHGSGNGGDPAEWNDRVLTSPTLDFRPLALEAVDVTRSVTFQSPMIGETPQFQINGQVFPNAPVFQPRANRVEEWHVTNLDPIPHPIHLHMQSFQSQAYRLGEPGYTLPPHFFDQDVWYMDPHTISVFRIRWKPTLGEGVYHCHNLFHEDGGMMALLNVIPEYPFFLSCDATGGGEMRIFPQAAGDSGTIETSALLRILPFGADYTGGFSSVAAGDVNFDGIPDAIVATFVGGRIRVLDGASRFSKTLWEFLPFGPNYPWPLTVAAGDINGDNRSDIIVGGGRGADGTVQVLSGRTGNLLASFNAYEPGFDGGLSLAAGNVDGSGRVRIVTAPAARRAPLVRIWGWDLFVPNDSAPPSSPLMGPPQPVAEFHAGATNDLRGLDVLTSFYAANAGGFLRIVTAPARSPERVRIWRCIPQAMHHGGEMHDAVEFESIGEIVPFTATEAPQGFSMTSVNAPLGSVLGFVPRGSYTNPTRLFHAPKGTYPAPQGWVPNGNKNPLTLGGS